MMQVLRRARRLSAALIVFAANYAAPAVAAETQITGKVIQSEGHSNPACRRVLVQRSDNGQVMTFRMGNYTSETSIPATVLTALASHLTVLIDYDPAQTTGCGTEPAIIFVTLFNS